MKHLLLVLVLTLMFLGALGQSIELPKKGSYISISEENCKYSKQTGELIILRDDSLKHTSYITDSSKLVIYGNEFAGFITGWDNKEEALEIYMHLDTLVTSIFENRLLSSDLLIKAYCVEKKVIDYEGDTIDWTEKVNSNEAKLLFINPKDLPEKYGDSINMIGFEIWLTFNPKDDGWGSFLKFELILESDREYTGENRDVYFKNANIICLDYTGMQI